ncbi:MAG: hypothetical protein WCQ95_01505 [Bacteroidota bacterium]
MIESRDKAVSMLRINNTPYWKLYNLAKTFLLAETDEDENLTIEGSIAMLEKRLDLIGSGQYHIEAWETKGKKKERKKFNFEIQGPQPINNQPNFIGAFPDPAKSIDEAVAAAVGKLKNEMLIESLQAKIKELEKQNEELNKEIDSSERRILDKVSPYIGDFVQALGMRPKNVSISGATENKQPKENLFTDSEAERLNKAFEKWSGIETQYITIVEKIADMAENDQATYSMAKGMLLSSNNEK